ncbi:hypothetical protein S83_055195, partial [Arachis hypogaea]
VLHETRMLRNLQKLDYIDSLAIVIFSSKVNRIGYRSHKPNEFASDLLHFTCKEKLPEEDPVEEVNPKELNPYLKDNGSGYPEESDRTKVVAERWGSLGDLTASNAVAPARAHVRAIRSRQRGETEEKSADTDKQSRRDYKR